MNVSLGQGVLVYQGAKVSALQPGGQPPLQASVAKEVGTATAATDRVTISDAARAMAAKDARATQAITPNQEKMLADAASGGPEFAARMAEEMATLPSTIFYDISDYIAAGVAFKLDKLSSTGRRVDAAFKERMTTEMAAIDAQRQALYNTEKAKGTNPVDIVAKMIDFTNAQSRDYLEASCWLGR
ncbi:hypothetical protein [Hydrogenophaga sp.]|uniref:hypothetical protein n=1 Tax=Hydrogenophaga sp. TaxID=1904254 RepID=UPI00391CA92D